MSTNFNNDIPDIWAARGQANDESACQLARQLAIPIDIFFFFILILEIQRDHPETIHRLNIEVLRNGGAQIIIPVGVHRWAQERWDASPRDRRPLLRYNDTMIQLWIRSSVHTVSDETDTFAHAVRASELITLFNDLNSAQRAQTQAADTQDTPQHQAAPTPALTQAVPGTRRWRRQNKENIDPRKD